MSKKQHHAAIRARASAAIADLYHNATPSYPRLCEHWGEQFESWFNEAARFEIEYLQDGGAYGSDYRATLEHPANGGKFKSEGARAYYVRKGLRDKAREQARCKDSREAAVNSLWERITEYGRLYTWGRGGRTLAPDKLTTGGAYWGLVKDYADDLSLGDCVQLIQIVESFNRFVRDWCRNVPDMWKEQQAELEAEACAESVGNFGEAFKRFADIYAHCAAN